MLKAITISLLVHLIVFSLGPGSPNAFEYQSGWPVSVGAGGLSHPVTADLDRDGQQEIVIGSSSSGNNVFVYKPDGRIMEGWPQDAGYFVIASPTIGDIDVDGDLEILVASFASNKVVAYHHDGTIVNGWPFSVGQNVRSTIALGNIDKAYQGLELVVGVQDGSVYVWHYDGTVMEGWPQMAGTFVERSSPGIADLDGDGDLEIIVGSYKNDTEYGSVYVWHHDGTPMARWPKQTSAHLTASAAIADIDSDGDLEIFLSGGKNVYGWHHDSSPINGWPQQTENWIKSSPSIGDVDSDGDLEIVVGSMGYCGSVYAWHHNGILLEGWPVMVDDGLIEDSSPVLGDIDGDGDIEIVIGSGSNFLPPGCTNWGENLYAFHHNGQSVFGFPVIINQKIAQTPLLDDIDRDGDIELVFGDGSYVLHVFDLPGAFDEEQMEWPMYQYDKWHTGWYHSFLVRCEGDFTYDGDVDDSDLAVFAADFGRTDCSGDCKGDFHTDGDVDGSNLAVFAADFGRTDCP